MPPVLLTHSYSYSQNSQTDFTHQFFSILSDDIGDKTSYSQQLSQINCIATIMSDLIVKFPQQRRRSSNNPSKKKKIRKQVTFSPVASLCVFQPNVNSRKHDNESSTSSGCCSTTSNEFWYASQDYTAMKLANMQTMRTNLQQYDELVSTNPQCIIDAYHTGNFDMNGIEFLTSKVLKQRSSNKKFHAKAILDEQDRQEQTGEVDPHRLKLISKHCSSWAVKRALSVAKL